MNKKSLCLFLLLFKGISFYCAPGSDKTAAKENQENGNPSQNEVVVGGTLSGLLEGNSVALLNNAQDELVLNQNGTFTFNASLPDLTTYNVSVSLQPSGQTCSVNNGAGPVSGENISSIEVICAVTTYTVSGILSGLNGGSIGIQNNGTDTLNLTQNGEFTFSMPVANGAAFSVTVVNQPSGMICQVTGGEGVVQNSNVSTVSISCILASFTLGGSLTGLINGQSVVIENQGDSLTLVADGPFSFSAQIVSGSSYLVSIVGQPAGQTCTLVNNSGVMVNNNIDTVSIQCVLNTYKLGGNVSGLNGTIFLQNSNREILQISTNGPFVFTQPVEFNAVYNVAITNVPNGQICFIINASGAMGWSDVLDMNIQCISGNNAGGTLSGLVPGKQISILLNGVEPLTLTSNGAFSYNLEIPAGTLYDITISSEPTGEVCFMANGSGTMPASSVNNVSIVCKHSLIINEVDYDNIGVDYSEFVEIVNSANKSESLSGYTLVFVNGLNGLPYNIVDLGILGEIAAGQYLVIGSTNAVSLAPAGSLALDLGPVSNLIQNGSPDGIALMDTVNAALVDALSYEGMVSSTILPGMTLAVSLVEGVALDPLVRDSTTVEGALCRYPDGMDTDNAATDWIFCTIPTPGRLNLP